MNGLGMGIVRAAHLWMALWLKKKNTFVTRLQTKCLWSPNFTNHTASQGECVITYIQSLPDEMLTTKLEAICTPSTYLSMTGNSNTTHAKMCITLHNVSTHITYRLLKAPITVNGKKVPIFHKRQWSTCKRP